MEEQWDLVAVLVEDAVQVPGGFRAPDPCRVRGGPGFRVRADCAPILELWQTTTNTDTASTRAQAQIAFDIVLEIRSTHCG